ncbi:MAG: serine/threonine protein kinase [Armatimonadetes bacterium]|nr:serine/threonine protein kinase [Armatimonadota bacterium]
MSSDPSTWRVGQVLDGVFMITGRLGQGGMSSVYQVHHREWDLSMAVKVPLPEVLGAIGKERFLREAQTWVDLGVHPNIVQCWFVREIDGLPVLFLDYLAGGSLKEWQEQGFVQAGEWSKILDLVIQACDGLGHAHDHGLVHRDVKPANLLIRGDESLCVTDFGLVKVGTAPELPAQTSWTPLERQLGASLTAVGSVVGTPEYGAPEQWDDSPVGPARTPANCDRTFPRPCRRRSWNAWPSGPRIAPPRSRACARGWWTSSARRWDSLTRDPYPGRASRERTL